MRWRLIDTLLRNYIANALDFFVQDCGLRLDLLSGDFPAYGHINIERHRSGDEPPQNPRRLASQLARVVA